MGHRKRMHPRHKEPNGPRYDCCKKCDSKFLLLQLNHVIEYIIQSYCENRRLFMTVIERLEKTCDKVT